MKSALAAGHQKATMQPEIWVYDGDGLLSKHEGFDSAWQAHKGRTLPVSLTLEKWVRKDA